MSLETPNRIASLRHRVNTPFKFDRMAFILIGLLLAVYGAATVAYPGFRISFGSPEQTANIELSGKFIGILVVESLAIVAVYKFFNRLNEWLKKAIKYLLKAFLYGIVVALAIVTAAMPYGGWVLAVWGVMYVLVAWMSDRKLLWTIHNLIALGFAVVGVVFGGLLLAPAAVIPLLIGLIIWDWLAVDLTDIMDSLIEFSGNLYIPNYVIVPIRSQIDLEAVLDFISDLDGGTKPDGVGFIIGVGDFVFPLMLPLSVVVTMGDVWSPVALASVGGILLSVPVMRKAAERRKEGLPALPWLNTGAMVGLGVGLVFTQTPVMEVLGLV